jgi:hypothetical protein
MAAKKGQPKSSQPQPASAPAPRKAAVKKVAAAKRTTSPTRVSLAKVKDLVRKSSLSIAAKPAATARAAEVEANLGGSSSLNRYLNDIGWSKK